MRVQKKNQARHLRRTMSLPEVLLWKRIQRDQIGFRIRRQYSLDDYILDFYCAEVKADIEVDGMQHAFKQTQDEIRNQWLESQGVTTIRISARMVLADSQNAADYVREKLEAIKANG